jgi:hypothetical protein
MEIRMDEPVTGKKAAEVCQALKEDEPPIYMGEMFLNRGALFINPINADEAIAGTVGDRLRAAISS